MTGEGAAAVTEDRAARGLKITFRRDGQQRTITGRVVIGSADGGRLVETPAGLLWTLEGSEIVDREPIHEPFTPRTQKEVAVQLLANLPAGFRVHTTKHYVVAYNTSRAYAQWTSSLLERLHKAFTNYWKRQGLELHEPQFPLVVQVFADQASYQRASSDDLPGGAGGIAGYYSLRTNHISMVDLTGMESLRGPGGRRGSLKQINQMLNQPAALPLVSTIVHEATHQIAFNCGLQTRYADIPLWLCEGMAVYFEAPDLTSGRGWRGIGKVNYSRLKTFRRNLPEWNKASLKNMLTKDRRFRTGRTAVAAYADAWALNYFLIKYRSKQYTAYLKTLAQKMPLMTDTSQTRLDEFTQHFGDLHKLEQDFLKQMARVR